MKPVSESEARDFAAMFFVAALFVCLALIPVPIIFYIRYLVWLWRAL